MKPMIPSSLLVVASIPPLGPPLVWLYPWPMTIHRNPCCCPQPLWPWPWMSPMSIPTPWWPHFFEFQITDSGTNLQHFDDPMISWSFSSRIVVLRYDWYSPIPMEPKMILLSWFGMQPPWLSWWSSEVMGVTIFSWFLRVFAVVWRCKRLAYLWQSIAINECDLPVRN